MSCWGKGCRDCSDRLHCSEIFHFSLDNSKGKVFVDCLGTEVEKVPGKFYRELKLAGNCKMRFSLKIKIYLPRRKL